MGTALVMLNVVIVVIQRGESRSVHWRYRKIVRSGFWRRQWLVWGLVVISWWAVGYRMWVVGFNNDDGVHILVLMDAKVSVFALGG